MILAIDPGLKPGAVVLEEDGEVIRASHRLKDVLDWTRDAGGSWPLTATELQWHYTNSKSRVQDILKLAFRAGFTLGNIPAVRRMALPPKVWRGGSNATKEQVQRRIAEQLTSSERELFRDIPTARHGDVLDAIGIGRAALRLAGTTKEYDFDLTA